MARGGTILIGFNLDTTGFQAALRAAPRRAADLTYRVLRINTTEIATEAKINLTKIQNPKIGPEGDQKGGLAQSIMPSRVYKQGSTMHAHVRWGLPYGKILEWGPSKKSWDIKAKHAPVLRFGWPNAPQGGFTATATGSKGGQRVMTLTANVFYFKRVRHVDRPSHRRVHVKPAVEKQEPIFIRDMMRIPKKVLR